MGASNRQTTAPGKMTPAVAAAVGGLPLRAYAAVVACVAWLVGMWLALGPLAPVGLSAWLGAVLVSAGAWAALWARGRHAAVAGPPRLRAVASGAQAVAIVALWLALGGLRGAWNNPARAADAISRFPTGVTVTVAGDVSQEPILEASGRLLVVDAQRITRDGGAHWEPASGMLQAHVSGPEDWFAPAYGDTLELTGQLAPITGSAPADVLARMTPTRVTITARGGGSPVFAWLFSLRVALAQRLERSLPEPEAALLIGILLGLKTPVLRARLALFTATGTIHLVVPAGLKVSVLADLSRRATAPLGRWISSAVSLAAVGVYAAVGGGGPAAVRAAIMGALLVLAPVFGRRYDVFAALAVAAFVMTAVQPGLLYDVGFQLTMLATLGIPLFAPALERLALRAIGRLPFRDALQPLVALVTVTIAAQLTTIPVVAQVFGIISFIAPVANLLVVPLLAPLLLLGGLVALLALAWPALGWLATFIAWPLLWLTDRAIEACARVPGAAIAVTNTPAWITWLYYGLLAGALLAGLLWQRRRGAASGGAARPPISGAIPHRRALFRGALVVVSLAVLLELWSLSPTLRAPAAEVDALDVGPGGWATLVRLTDGTTALIDGGASGPSLDLALASALPFWQRGLAVLALTDPGAGTEPGLQDALAHYTVSHAVDMGALHPTTVYLAWLDALRQSGTPLTRVREGDVIHLGSRASMRVLAPPAMLYPDSGGATAQSDDMILRLDLPGLRMLLLGNADAYALDALASSGEPLQADVVEVALPTNVGVNLDQPLGLVLRLARPRLVIISDAPTPPGRHIPATSVPGAVWPPDGPTAQSLGAPLLRVATTGAVVVRQGPDGRWRYQ